MAGLEVFENEMEEIRQGEEDKINKLNPKSIMIKDINLSTVDFKVEIISILRANTLIKPKTSAPEYTCNECNKKYRQKPKKCSCQCDYFSSVSKINNCIESIFEEEIAPNQDTSTIGSIKAIFLKNTTRIIHELYIGRKYKLTGIIKIETDGKDESFYLEAESIIPIDEGIESIKLTDQEIDKIKSLSQDPDLIPKLKSGIFGTDLFDLDLAQEACILTMVSAPKIYVKNTLKERGIIDILFISSPGSGKSVMLKRVAAFFPKSKYTTGSGASAIGITASVEKDERLGQYVLRAGSLALCHKGGVNCIDEIDKIDPKEITKLNTQMDSLIIPIDKASIHCRLLADVSIIGAMNPKFGVFDPFEEPFKQINLRKDFLDRFDLIFNLDFFKSKEHNTEVAKRIIALHGPQSQDDETLSRELYIKYFAYCRSINPVISGPGRESILIHYNQIIGTTLGDKEYHYSTRLLENFTRIIKAYSRLRLKSEIDEVDILDAKNMILSAMKSLGLAKSEPSGQITIDTIKSEEITPKSKRDKIYVIKEIIKEKGMISYEELITEADKVKIELKELDEILTKLKNGDIYEPRNGFYKIL